MGGAPQGAFPLSEHPICLRAHNATRIQAPRGLAPLTLPRSLTGRLGHRRYT